jgi:membrane protein DedA with SNARE-associated domain
MFAGWPFAGVFAFMFTLAMLRGQATYWLARLVTEKALLRDEPSTGWRGRVAAWLVGKDVSRGADTIRRIGLVAIPLGYLTVGFQTLVLAGAGVLRIRPLSFTLAQLPGAIAWATIYSTIGWAVWGAAVAALAGSPWGMLGFVSVALVGAVTWRVHRRWRSRSAFDPDDVGSQG